MLIEYPVFISYRRSDLSLEAEWLYNLIQTFFGDQVAFFDKGEIAGGTQWDDSLRSCVRSAKLVLILIAPAWLKEQADNSSFFERQTLKAVTRSRYRSLFRACD